MVLRIIFVALLMAFYSGLFSQTNLVPNPIFKDVAKKVKGDGQIELASPWVSPTLAPADLYISDTKNSLIGVPNNAYGEEKAMVGDNYAGFLAYSYKNKEPRSYLQVKLSEPLKEGKEYCVTLNVSLADLSKYACNHLGAYISKDAVSANNTDVMLFDPQIVSRKLSVYDKQFYWTPICSVYKAKGGEQYLTIGNFTPDDNLTTVKVKRPRGFTSPQTYDAYYYLDNISVVLKGKESVCDCDTDPSIENAEVVSRNFNSDASSSVGEVKIINTDGTIAGSAPIEAVKNGDLVVISFDPKSFSIIGDATTKLNQLVEVLKTSPLSKISLAGYYDASEKEIEKLDAKRVMSIYKYLVSKGVKKETIERTMEGTNNAQKDVLKNMKVEIKIISEEDSAEDKEE